MSRKKIKVILFPDIQVLDIAGPVAVFEGATSVLARSMGYEVSLVSSDPLPVHTSGCISIPAHENFESVDLSEVDTLLIPGGSKGTPSAMRDLGIRELIISAHKRKVRIVSICTGAFILAEAGILSGRKCTTHWSEMDNLRRMFPDVEVLTDVIFHNEDYIWTSAGVTTGIDMSLAIVARDFGQNIAQKVARNLVLYMARPGHIEQLSEFVNDRPTVEEKLLSLVMHIRATPNANHSVESMAERCNMSPRNFTRKFKNSYGKTPAVMVRQVRVERAELYMKTKDFTQKRIASLSGFSSVDAMRQAISAVRRR